MSQDNFDHRPIGKASRARGAFSIGHVVAVALALVCFAGAAAWFLHRPAGVQAVAIQQEVEYVIAAMHRAKLDSNCFPSRLDALVDASRGSTSTCGSDLAGRLRGPYLQRALFDDAGSLLLRTAPGPARLQVARIEGATEVELLLSGVPLELAVQLLSRAHDTGHVVRFSGATGRQAMVRMYWRL